MTIIANLKKSIRVKASRPLVVTVNCTSSGGLSANGNEEKDASNDK